MQRGGRNIELTRTFVEVAVEELNSLKPTQFEAHFSVSDSTVGRWKEVFAKGKVPRAKAGIVALFLKKKKLAPEQFAFSDDACKAINAFLRVMQEENPSERESETTAGDLGSTNSEMPIEPDSVRPFLSDDEQQIPAAGGKRLRHSWMVTLTALAVGLMIVAIVGVIVILARQSGDSVQVAPVAVMEGHDNHYEKLASLLRSNTWVCYNPSRLKIPGVAGTDEETHGTVDTGPQLDERDIIDDLETIRSVASGLITFGSDGNLGDIPRIAKKNISVPFQGVFMGLFIDSDRKENMATQLRNAKNQTEADGYVLFFAKSGMQIGEMEKIVDDLRSSTGKYVAVRRSVVDYLGSGGADYLDVGDFICADIETPWREGVGPDDAADALRSDIRQLADHVPKRRIVVLNMISFSSGGKPGLTPENQAKFFKMVLRDVATPHNMFKWYYDAFDPPVDTKLPIDSEGEKYRGLFSNDRSAKPVVDVFRQTMGPQ
jgi:hypothetical protein